MSEFIGPNVVHVGSRPFWDAVFDLLELNDKQKKQFEEIIDLHALNGAVTDKNIFEFGFRLAVNLILDSRKQ